MLVAIRHRLTAQPLAISRAIEEGTPRLVEKIRPFRVHLLDEPDLKFVTFVGPFGTNFAVERTLASH